MSLNTLRNSSDAEPGLILAGALALLVHLAFIALMIFGLNWKTEPPAGMVVDLWQELPQPIQPPVKTTSPKPVEPKPAPTPEPPKQEPKPEPQKVAAPPPVKKPEIALKQKPEPPVKDKKPDLEEQKKKELEKKELEKKEQEKLKAKEQAEKQRLQDEKAAKQKQEQEAKAQREAQAQREVQQAAAKNRMMSEVEKYKAMILTKIKSRIVMPPDLPGNPVTEFTVTLLPGGDILDVKLRKSSGFATFDSAVERAIFLSKPLPVPPDPSLFNEFRNLNITVHYLE